MQIIIIDNYDSFTYNLYHLIDSLLLPGDSISVFRNDEIKLGDLDVYDKIVLSPGPGLPAEAGITCDVIRTYGQKKSILGVCLGHQAIGIVYGAKLQNLKKVMHGKQVDTHIINSDESLFKGMPRVFQSGRYHSWVISKISLPGCLLLTAEDNDGYIMAMRHNQYDIRGVQFHPESVMTKWGLAMLKNWLYGN